MTSHCTMLWVTSRFPGKFPSHTIYWGKPEFREGSLIFIGCYVISLTLSYFPWNEHQQLSAFSPSGTGSPWYTTYGISEPQPTCGAVWLAPVPSRSLCATHQLLHSWAHHNNQRDLRDINEEGTWEGPGHSLWLQLFHRLPPGGDRPEGPCGHLPLWQQLHQSWHSGLKNRGKKNRNLVTILWLIFKHISSHIFLYIPYWIKLYSLIWHIFLHHHLYVN